MQGTDAGSQYFKVRNSSRTSSYSVTINYTLGHWCTCRGMLSKKNTFRAAAGTNAGTSCKHIVAVINEQFGGSWGAGTQQVRTGRVAAIEATRAKRERQVAHVSAFTLLDRIANLKSSATE